MRWVTREKAKVERTDCPWLIGRFVDSDAEFIFLPHNTDWSPTHVDRVVFDVPGTELGPHGEYCACDAIIARYRLDDGDAALELARIVRAADTPGKD